VKRLLLWVSGAACFVALLWLGWSFRVGNETPIDLDLVWVQFHQVELWRVILLAIGIGAVASALCVGFAWLQSRLLNRRYRRAIRRLESELHEMRSLPLTGSEPSLAMSDPDQASS
jgi:uncharacterized membrane protein YciS (DUF1049 family)